MSETISREESLREDVSVATGETLVEVSGLKTYYEDGGLFGGNPVKAVDGVSFDIERGETLGLVGESGCGKTTLGRTLVQLEKATDGEVLFDGTDVTELSGETLKKWRRNAQIVFQDPESSLNDRMTVGEIVREPLDVHEWQTPRERRDRVRELLETVGLQEKHYYRYPHQFSGGQRQRIGIARALALEPEFVVLDEPVSALDVSVQAKILNLLEDLQDEFGLTYLFIAHDLSVVRHICDRVAVMYLGHVMELGPTEELFEEPANPYTHSLLSAIPEPDPTVERDRITLRGTPPSPRDPPAGCPFTTRCPAKIRPPEFEGVDDETWEGIEVFREVVRERTRTDKSMGQRVRELLGMETAIAGMTEVVEEAFGDPQSTSDDLDEDERIDRALADVPETVAGPVREAAGLVQDGDADAADERLEDAFGSKCDADEPADHGVSDSGRYSHCHRHEPDHEEPGEFFARSLGHE